MSTSTIFPMVRGKKKAALGSGGIFGDVKGGDKTNVMV